MGLTIFLNNLCFQLHFPHFCLAKLQIQKRDNSLYRFFNFFFVVFVYNKAVTDPEVIFFNGVWYMYLASENGIVVTTSNDGLNFKDVSEINVDGIPGTKINNDKLELFGCDIGNITKFLSNNGIIFENKKTIISDHYCDPSPIELNDGSSLLVIKTDSRRV